MSDSDKPKDSEKPEFNHCKSINYYYGIETAIDYEKARKCAFFEKESDDDVNIGGSKILLMLYANGYGVKKNIDLAMRMACNDIRDEHDKAAELFNQLTKFKNSNRTTFDICDENPSDCIPKKSKAEIRCGWFHNPTPSNARLEDKDGEWLIATQGGYQADGDWPSFNDDQWQEVNGHYGYGCACMKVIVNYKDKKILKIINSYVKPLTACDKDKSLPKKIT